MQELRIKVYGKVQGVGFRFFCQQKARELGLVGKARNLADGAVEVIVQGQPRELAQLLTWCQQGPNSSRIDRLEKQKKEIDQSSYLGFEVE